MYYVQKTFHIKKLNIVDFYYVVHDYAISKDTTIKGK